MKCQVINQSPYYHNLKKKIEFQIKLKNLVEQKEI